MASLLAVWTESETENLIHLVQTYSCLFDCSGPSYKDVEKNNALEVIATRMGQGKRSVHHVDILS